MWTSKWHVVDRFGNYFTAWGEEDVIACGLNDLDERRVLELSLDRSFTDSTDCEWTRVS
jgi:hypothetical protein